MTLVAVPARHQPAGAGSSLSKGRGTVAGSALLGGFVVAVTLLGALSAVAAALVSRHVWRTGEMMLPWGMILAVGGSVATVYAARTQARTAGFAAAAGWIGGLLLVLSGPGGDLVVAGDVFGYGFLLGATAAVFITAGWRQRPP